jgi:hypothetical protein
MKSFISFFVLLSSLVWGQNFTIYSSNNASNDIYIPFTSGDSAGHYISFFTSGFGNLVISRSILDTVLPDSFRCLSRTPLWSSQPVRFSVGVDSSGSKLITTSYSYTATKEERNAVPFLSKSFGANRVNRLLIAFSNMNSNPQTVAAILRDLEIFVGGAWMRIDSVGMTGSPDILAPVLYQPANGTTNINYLNTKLTSFSVVGVTGYKFSISVQGYPNPIVINSADSQIVVSLPPLKLIQWNVRGMVSGVEGPPSPTWSFMTASSLQDSIKLAIPALLEPLNGATNISYLNTGFSCFPVIGATGYKFKIYIQDYPDTVTISSVSSQILFSLPPSKLVRWSVRAVAGTVDGPSSATWAFTTANTLIDSTSISAPILQEPANGATSISYSNTKFSCFPVIGATGYKFKIYIQGYPDSLVINSASTQINLSLPPLKLIQWNVRGTANGVDGLISSTWSFVTSSTLTEVSKNILYPGTFGLAQNYPNPFNPTTKILFSLEKNGYADLRVYDLLGREVTTLINSELASGFHEVIFSGIGLPSGTYVYRLFAGGRTEVCKMVLQK